MERWSSRVGFLLAAIGAAVGLGNIWRFSAVVGQNGGGAYLVPYLLAVFVFAVPLLILELAVGRHLRRDVVASFGSVRREFAVVGWIVAGSVLLILSYYLVLTGWVLAFLVASVGGGDVTFAAFTGTLWPVVAFALTTLVTAAVVSFGVRSGIERLAKVVVPVIVLLLFGLAMYAATLPGFGRAVTFLFQPDVSVLGDPLLWSAAFGQVFFSLSVGQGIMLTYGSYLDAETDLRRSAITIAVADVGIAVLAGLVVFPVVFSVGLEPTLGTELAFSTLPQAFAEMPSGRVVAVAFFGLLFFAAVTSAVSLLEVDVAAVSGATGRSRRQVTVILTGLVFLLGLPSALSYSAIRLSVGDVPVLDLVDQSVGAFALPITATFVAVIFAWYQDAEVLDAQIGRGLVRSLVRFIVPVVLVSVVVLRLLSEAGTAWQYTGPGAESIAPLSTAAFLFGVGFLVRAVGRILVRWRPPRVRDEPTERGDR